MGRKLAEHCGHVWLPDRASHSFTEPCLSFSAGRDHQGIALRVYLSHEAEPPFALVGRRGENYLPIQVSPEELRLAAQDLERELRRFPVRPA